MKVKNLIPLALLLLGWLMPITAPVASVAAASPQPAVVADSSSGGATTNGWTDPVGG